MPSQMPESFVDVLVIGAGPAGLMCSNALAAASDIKVKVIDQRSSKVTLGQADGIQPRTTEVFQSYGLAERMLREGNQIHVMAFYDPNPNGEIELTRRACDWNAPTARYPFSITLHQGMIESIFIDSMIQHGLSIDRPIRPCAIELARDQTLYPVKVTLEHLDAAIDAEKTEVIHAKYVVGADGAHSWVRKHFGITMDGDQTEYIWGVIDMTPDTNFPDIRNSAAIHSNSGSCMLIPREGDKVRLYVQLLDEDVIDPATGRVDRNRVTPERILEAAKKIYHPFYINPLSGIEWWTIYIIGQRVASTYSVDERVFIAGDACHTHSPKAGQGMNASMNDTHNLAWKIAQVLRGWARPSILKTYESERREYAQGLIDFDKQLSGMFSGKPKTLETEDGVSHVQKVFRRFNSFMIGVGVHYGPSEIVNDKHQQCAKNLTIGKRMPPRMFVRTADARPMDIQDLLPSDLRWKILVFVGTLNESRRPGVELLAKELNEPMSFLRKYPVDGQISQMFDITAIMAGNKKDANYLDVPVLFRPHWSKVLLDDTDVTGTMGGGAYKSFGIDTDDVTFVVVRPDGYVGMIAPSSALSDLYDYFASFLIPRTTL